MDDEIVEEIMQAILDGNSEKIIFRSWRLKEDRLMSLWLQLGNAHNLLHRIMCERKRYGDALLKTPKP